MNLESLHRKSTGGRPRRAAVAERSGNPDLLPEHLALALVTQPEGVVPAVLSKMQVDTKADDPGLAGVNRQAASRAWRPGRPEPAHAASAPGGEIRSSAAQGRVHQHGASPLALASESGRAPAADVFKKAGVTRDAILQALTTVRGSQRVTDQNPEGKYQALERYGRDLTDVARKGKLDPVIGRDDEIRA
jgi:ATP-dependent Clp protease ATP-binding subunit ClpB